MQFGATSGRICLMNLIGLGQDETRFHDYSCNFQNSLTIGILFFFFFFPPRSPPIGAWREGEDGDRHLLL